MNSNREDEVKSPDARIVVNRSPSTKIRIADQENV